VRPALEIRQITDAPNPIKALLAITIVGSLTTWARAQAHAGG